MLRLISSHAGFTSRSPYGRTSMSVASPHTGDELCATSQVDYICSQCCCQLARFIPPPIEAGEFSRSLVKFGLKYFSEQFFDISGD